MKRKNIIALITFLIILIIFFVTKNISPDIIKNLGLVIPLPIFTFLIALVDGFNPCNLFVLTLLLSLMLSSSNSRKKIYAVGYSFIIVVYFFYFLFMATWLNIFKYIGLVDPLRIFIGILAVIAGLINCKEYFFYRKGITLMVQDKHVGPLKKRIQNVADLLKKGSIPTLIGASMILAIFSSLVELPCTAGFPIIYTGILSNLKMSNIQYYLYLLYYNLVYVFPLLIIITVLGFTFQGKQIEKSTMALIKFIGGAIMLILGIILLCNPSIIGI